MMTAGPSLSSVNTWLSRTMTPVCRQASFRWSIGETRSGHASTSTLATF